MIDLGPPETLRQKVMETASLFEGDFTVDWLVELTGFKAHQILTELQEEVEARNLLSPKLGIYSFRTGAKRTEWKKGLAPDEEKDLHRRIVQLFLRDLPEDGDQYGRLARHLLKVDNDLEGCRLLGRAGDFHRKAFRAEQAFQCYHKVLLDLKNRKTGEADRLFTETAVKYSKISTARHDTVLVLSTLNQALERARARGDVSHEALLRMHIAKNEWLRADYGHALAHFEAGWSLVAQLDDPQLVDAVMAFGPFFLYWQGRFREAVSSYERSVREVEKYPQSSFPLLGAITVGYCHAQVGNHTQGLGMLDAIRTLCLEKGDFYLASYAIGNIGEIMLDLRRLDDALHYMVLAAKYAEETDNRWVWMVAQVILAFAYYLKGDGGRATKHLKDFLKYREKVRATVLPYPYLLALGWAMEQGRLGRIKDLSLDREIKSMTSSNNIFMRGLGSRFLALTLEKNNAPPERIIEAHENSLALLGESGHLISLVRSRLEFARYLDQNGDREKARLLTAEASRALSVLDEKLAPDDLRSLIERDNGPEHLLKEILDLGRELVKIRDSRDLLQRIISAGNRVTGAERGAIFMLEDDESGRPGPRLRASRNLTSDQARGPYFASSLRMIAAVMETGRGVIAGPDPEEGEPGLSSENQIRSKICVPLLLHDQVVGVLYHDNRLLSSAFKEKDLGVLSYFSAQAAIALDNARAYEEINRLNVKLTQEKQYFEEEHLSHLHFHEIVGQSRPIKQVTAKIEQVAPTEAAVLITGETGVGKELVARAIHRHGPRKDRSFIGLHLGALPEGLMAGELMGHEKGAFTGAVRRKAGRFELADGGTLFLDEIGEISRDIQVRLLRVLQTRQFERVGGVETLQSDFRLIAATNRDLKKEVREGRFRADLYYRLNVFPIHVPPLRERKEDIPPLAAHFLTLHAGKLNKNISYIPEREMRKLMRYDWPGNIRELQNVIERGVILSLGPDFRMPELETDLPPATGPDDEDTLPENEKRHLIRVLEKTGWQVAGKKGAAAILGVPASTLAFKMKKLGLGRPERPSPPPPDRESDPDDDPGRLSLPENERRHIIHILEKTGWQVAGKNGAAAVLGVPPSTLAFRMKKLGIKRPG
ncbi:MAG: sigma 54-interacting transcriptional regulator [Pseudomonadota bacterium]